MSSHKYKVTVCVETFITKEVHSNSYEGAAQKTLNICELDFPDYTSLLVEAVEEI